MLVDQYNHRFKKVSVEAGLMSVQPCFRRYVSWEYLPEVFPKRLAVGSVSEMCKLVNDDIFKHPLGGEYQTPVDVYRTMCAA